MGHMGNVARLPGGGWMVGGHGWWYHRRQDSVGGRYGAGRLAAYGICMGDACRGTMCPLVNGLALLSYSCCLLGAVAPATRRVSTIVHPLSATPPTVRR